MQVELKFVPLDAPHVAVVLLLLESEDLCSMAQAACHHEDEAYMGDCWHTAIGNQHTAVVLGSYEAAKPAQLHMGFVKAVALVAEDLQGMDMEGEVPAGLHRGAEAEAWLVR